MENEIVCLDTSILIDLYRKKAKEKSAFFQLTGKFSLFATSVITEYEIMVGATSEQIPFWNDFFSRVTVLPFDKRANQEAISIYKQLKQTSKLIELPDLFIGATAVANKLKIATLNKKHFERIPGLELIDL